MALSIIRVVQISYGDWIKGKIRPEKALMDFPLSLSLYLATMRSSCGEESEERERENFVEICSRSVVQKSLSCDPSASTLSLQRFDRPPFSEQSS